jgi:Ku protein
MATPRAYWKGYLKLSLVTCPVALFPASSQSEKTRFHQINRKTGNRLRQQMVDEETGRVVDRENKGRGYELGNGKYVEIEPEELEAVEIESTHTIDIDKFVPRKTSTSAITSALTTSHRTTRAGRKPSLSSGMR